MCECLSKINEKLREHNTVIPPVIFFNGQPSRPEIVVEKLNKSIKGKTMGVMLRFCPFCGEEYAAQQNAHLTGGGLCAECGSPSWAHGAIGHDFVPPHPQVA